ncbi:hypothetical protein NKH77_38240 [Streptomyces sp. M19]
MSLRGPWRCARCGRPARRAAVRRAARRGAPFSVRITRLGMGMVEEAAEGLQLGG